MTTPNLQLPEVPVAIQEASDELNAGFWTLDALTQLSVIDRAHTLATLPASAVQGDRYIVASGERANHVAYRAPAGWRYYVPREGMRAWSVADDELYVFRDGGWEPLIAAGTRTLGAAWVRAGDPIETPVNIVYLQAPISGTIRKVTVTTSGGTGSCVIDVQQDTYANFPPSSDSICASAKPTIASDIKYTDEVLSGWTTAIAAGDVLAFVLESSSTFTYICVQLFIEEAT